jgi:murein DD-endopeptidase MepM/ murein hydrolase activator NlpD
MKLSLSMKYKFLILFIVIFLLTVSSQVGQAQTEGPIYIVQPGDSLNSIADRFGINVNDLLTTNNISDPNLISAGTQLIIPSLPEISGILNTEVVPFGETIRSLSKRYQVSEELLNKLNRITSPSEVYVGSSLILLQQDNQVKLDSAKMLSAGSTFLDLAIENNANPWSYALGNGETSTWSHNPAEMVFLDSSGQENVFSSISPKIKSVQIFPLPLSQGDTAQILIETNERLEFDGTLGEYELKFYKAGENKYVALQGIHAMSQSGLIPINLTFSDASGNVSSFQQSLLLKTGGFGQDPPLMVDSETIDPAVTKPEENQIKSITSLNKTEKMWEGLWKPPTANPECIKSRYGNRRSYNGSDFMYFHQGVDYGVCIEPSLSIFAPAAGEVVFSGPLTVRGNTTIIDHGWGIYSAYFHQAEIKVKVGDKVSLGDDIGTIGATGRVTGPHLHWEIWVNGVQVQPLDWLVNTYPQPDY